MITINTKKKIVKKVNDKNGKVTIQKAKTIGEFVGNSNNFDKHQSVFHNQNGYTYVISNPKGEKDDVVDVYLKFEYADEDLKRRFLAGASDETKANIELIKEEYYG